MDKTVALIGAGALGTIIGTHLPKGYRLLGVLSQNFETSKPLAEKTNSTAFTSITHLLSKRPDYVIEAAGVGAVTSYGKAILQGGGNFIVLSVGALADTNFYNNLKKTARENNVLIHIPSGAIGGFDLMRTLSCMEQPQVKITSTKSPKSLKGAPYLENQELSMEIKQEIFSGTAQDAISGFPQNVNVAVATALATGGMDHTQVSIVSDPKTTTNTHKIVLKNSLVETRIQVESNPDPANPKSSTLTAWSVLALLKQLASPVHFF